ncbi:glycosyltransferase [Rhizobium sp. RM]|uniref:glycosyltransferase n=1 Tax=Rhizobium sp. RM TaxID=2748079 RepID=UPI001FEE93FD|nr:glycosyltransferase [Rhizobium sp. RM]
MNASLHNGKEMVVVISDFQDGIEEFEAIPSVDWFRDQWLSGARGAPPHKLQSVRPIEVVGGYLDRLPLSLLKSGIVSHAEIWSHWRGTNPPIESVHSGVAIRRRAFRMNGPSAPFSSNDMLGFIAAFGPPSILCVWGLGVDESILKVCDTSFKIYNSIDVPALRVPPDVSRHFDLVLTGADWQSDEVLARHPSMLTAVMPIGPEFASDMTFRPLGLQKHYDIIYVAAAQAYKRHDILFAALARLPRSLRTLCVCGYGEMADDLHRKVQELGLTVDFVDPPGLSFEGVNRTMNMAKMGVVCGIDDGAPAILTEYMLAGIPVLANSHLRCGLQYITPETGMTASPENFHEGIRQVLNRLDHFQPRSTVLRHWTWRHSVQRLQELLN